MELEPGDCKLKSICFHLLNLRFNSAYYKDIPLGRENRKERKEAQSLCVTCPVTKDRRDTEPLTLTEQPWSCANGLQYKFLTFIPTSVI